MSTRSPDCLQEAKAVPADKASLQDPALSQTATPGETSKAALEQQFWLQEHRRPGEPCTARETGKGSVAFTLSHATTRNRASEDQNQGVVFFFGNTLKGQKRKGSGDFPVLTGMQKKAPRFCSVVYHKAARQSSPTASCKTPTRLLHILSRGSGP